MKRRMLGALGAVLVMATVAATRFGGWAVVSVDTIPEYFVAGRPLSLTFVVRQHGHNPLEGLKPAVSARLGSKVVEGRAWELPKEGTYRAIVTVPQAGDWNITIESGFGSSKGRLSLKAVDSTQTVAALTAADRGRQLFAAKGCVTCHVHRAVDIAVMLPDFGPDLTDKRFAPEYLEKFLADPSIKPQAPNKPTMPNPMLKQLEIASLVAFINSNQRLTSR